MTSLNYKYNEDYSTFDINSKINNIKLERRYTTSNNSIQKKKGQFLRLETIKNNPVFYKIRSSSHSKVFKYKIKKYGIIVTNMESFRWVKIFNFIPFIGKILSKIIKKTTSISAEGTIKTDVDIKFKLVSRSSSVIGVVVTYFRTNTDLSFMFGNAKISPFSGIISPIKKEVEKKILDVFAKIRLQEAINRSVDKLAYKLLKKIG